MGETVADLLADDWELGRSAAGALLSSDPHLRDTLTALLQPADRPVPTA